MSESYFRVAQIYTSGGYGVAQDRIAAFQWALIGLETKLWENLSMDYDERQKLMQPAYLFADETYAGLSAAQRKEALRNACDFATEWPAIVRPQMLATCPGDNVFNENAIRYRP
jgi:hypothetical protein